MQNKTIFITGTSSGIGRATVKYFLDKGWNVIATMKSPEKEVEFKNSDALLLEKVDVTDSNSIASAFNAGIKKFGKIDVIVNNAGYGLLGPLENTTEEQVRAQFDVNVLGTVNTIRSALPHFRENKGGKIINIASMLGRITLPFMSIYAASKHAVEGLSEDLYYELKDLNIQVKVIEPGTIRTDFFTTSLVRAESDTVKAYDSYWHPYIKNMIERGSGGKDPVLAAEVIYRAVNDNSTRLRYKVDTTAKMLILLRKTYPLWLFQWIISKVVR
ncbi:MAG: SDR family oxidoreductase [Candidatus Zambryskibacteria bacterium]|nr:SDR family oxidoreductase [Candidatus Zambryskibacteria bacterium]